MWLIYWLSPRSSDWQNTRNTIIRTDWNIQLVFPIRAIARAGLLHDLFYYDWRKTKFDLGTHAFIHPRIALRNAEKLTELSPMEKDIIIKHMWGATVGLPKYKESFVVSLVDDYAAMDEVVVPWMHKLRHPIHTHLKALN